MQASEFQKYFTKVPTLIDHFVGVFSIDNFPTTLDNRSFLVCNLSKANEPGSHWVCIYRDLNVEIFDPLGTQISYFLPRLTVINQVPIIYNTNQYQSSTTSSCGLFVITFAVERFLNLSMSFEHLLEEIFTDEIEINESKVNFFCQQLLNDY
jgi:hypothetical protein